MGPNSLFCDLRCRVAYATRCVGLFEVKSLNALHHICEGHCIYVAQTHTNTPNIQPR